MVIGDIHPEFGQIFIAMGGMGVNIVEHLIRQMKPGAHGAATRFHEPE
jgi:hypothetical protein